jgi:hypothetical protein
MRIFITFIITISALIINAQSNKTVDEIAKVLQNEVLFIKYRTFKSDFESMSINKAKEINNYRDYEKLRVAYKEVEYKYNEFLIKIKTDLSDYNEIKKMTKAPADYALKYQSNFNEVIKVYMSNYLPVYESMNHSKEIKVTPSLIQLGIELFTSVVDLIKNRKEDRQLSMNAILGSVNTYFYKQIRMKEWGELPIPNPKSNTDEVVSNASPTQRNGNKPKSDITIKRKPNQSIPTPTTNEPSVPVPSELPSRILLPDVTVPAPSFEEIRGWVEFNKLENSEPKPMSFNKKTSKSITVEELRTNGTDVISNTSTANVSYFNSVDVVGNGTQFNIKVFNKSGMYIFALNSNNKVEFLYPFKNEKLGNCNTDKAQGKDITVLEATPLVGQNEDGITILPIPNCEKTPPAPRYFTIQGTQTTPENFCIIFSKSELNIEQIAKRLETEEGALHDRLTKTFGNYLITPNQYTLEVENNRFSFDASGATQNVLPFVFYINRK